MHESYAHHGMCRLRGSSLMNKFARKILSWINSSPWRFNLNKT